VRALTYAARGFGIPWESELPSGSKRRAARLATGKHAELVALLRSAVPDILDGDLQLEVTLRIAEIARSHLGDAALAKEYYARTLELRSDDRRALVALESLYEETSDHALCWRW